MFLFRPLLPLNLSDRTFFVKASSFTHALTMERISLTCCLGHFSFFAKHSTGLMDLWIPQRAELDGLGRPHSWWLQQSSSPSSSVADIFLSSFLHGSCLLLPLPPWLMSSSPSSSMADVFLAIFLRGPCPDFLSDCL